MNTSRHTIRIVVCFLSVCMGFLFSCSNTTRSITLLTDVPDMAQALRNYFITEGKMNIDATYTESPIIALMQNNNADIIISTKLNDPTLKKYFYPMYSITPDIPMPFIRNIKMSSVPFALPLSFDVFGVIVKQQNNTFPPTVTMDFLKEHSIAVADSNSQKFGVSPMWNTKFLLAIAEQYDIMSMSPQGLLQYNSDNLTRTFTYLESWITDAMESPEREQELRLQYRSQFPAKMVLQNITPFAFMTSSEFLSLPAQYRSSLSFHPIANEDKTITMRNTVYVALPQKGRIKFTADFLRQLQDYRTQLNLTQYYLDRGQAPLIFGRAFSSVWAYSATMFSHMYDGSLWYMIPSINQVKVATYTPWYWDTFAEKVFVPFLEEKLYQKENTTLLKTLEERSNTWKNNDAVFSLLKDIPSPFITQESP